MCHSEEYQMDSPVEEAPHLHIPHTHIRHSQHSVRDQPKLAANLPVQEDSFSPYSLNSSLPIH